MAQDGHAPHTASMRAWSQFALAEYGIGSDIEAVAVQVNTDQAAGFSRSRPFYNPDGTFNGHAILVVPAARRIDATVQQFGEVRARLGRPSRLSRSCPQVTV